MRIASTKTFKFGRLTFAVHIAPAMISRNLILSYSSLHPFPSLKALLFFKANKKGKTNGKQIRREREGERNGWKSHMFFNWFGSELTGAEMVWGQVDLIPLTLSREDGRRGDTSIATTKCRRGLPTINSDWQRDVKIIAV